MASKFQKKRLNDIDKLLSEAAVKSCEILNLAEIDEDLKSGISLEVSCAARIVYLAELAREKIRQTLQKAESDEVT